MNHCTKAEMIRHCKDDEDEDEGYDNDGKDDDDGKDDNDCAT